MSALRPVVLVGIALIFGMLLPGAVAQAAQPAPPVVRQLPANPRSPAFRFGLEGGFSTLGSFTVTIYTDGRVSLKKEQRSSPIHLIKSREKVYPIALTGLLRLANAEHFFSMPARIIPKHPTSDLATAFVSVYTRTGVKTVKVVGNNPKRFYELYSLLNYVAGAAS